MSKLTVLSLIFMVLGFLVVGSGKTLAAPAASMNSSADISFYGSYTPEPSTPTPEPPGIDEPQKTISSKLPQTGSTQSFLLQGLGIGSIITSLFFFFILIRKIDREKTKQIRQEKMQMKFKKIALATMLAMSASLVTVPAFAEDGGVLNSIGDVTFTQPNTLVTPTDPTEPGEEVTPLDPDNPGTGTAGPLSIDYVSYWHFGDQIISGSNKTYYAAPDEVLNGTTEKEVPNYVQVTDDRGSNVGWHLTVTQDDQFTSGANVLTGAVLEVKNSVVNGVNGTAYAPTPATGTITLVPGGSAQEVMTAAVGKGMGTWTDAFGDDSNLEESISLTVPGTTAKVAAKYTTTLTWTLTDAP